MIYTAKVFDVLGDVTRQGSVCDIALLTSVGTLKLRYKIRTVQGHDYIHVLDQRLVDR